MRAPRLSLAYLALIGGLARAEAPVHDDKDFLAVTDEQVNKAVCGRKKPYTVSELLDWFKQQPDTELKAQAQRAATSQDAGAKLKALFVKARYGFEIGSSPIAFSPDQLDTVLLALSDFPPSTFKNIVDKGTSGKRNFIRRVPGPSGNALADTGWTGIRFFDNWAGQSPQAQRDAGMHELGHFMASSLALDYSKTWQSLSDWKLEPVRGAYGEIKTEWTKKDSTIPSRYGESSPFEDFAESVTSYRFDPENLRRRSPKKYKFLKEVVFDGLEYDRPTHCAPGQSLSAKALKKLSATKPAVSIESLPASFNYGVSKACRSSAGSGDSNRCEKGGAFANCVRKRMAPQAVTNAFKGSNLWFGRMAAQGLARRYSNEIENMIDDSTVAQACKNFYATDNTYLAQALADAEKSFLGTKKGLNAVGANGNLNLNISQFCNDLVIENGLPFLRGVQDKLGHSVSPRFLVNACVAAHESQGWPRRTLTSDALMNYLKQH